MARSPKVMSTKILTYRVGGFGAKTSSRKEAGGRMPSVDALSGGGTLSMITTPSLRILVENESRERGGFGKEKGQKQRRSNILIVDAQSYIVGQALELPTEL